ncbi:hypothetical protein NHX12_015205 [Muraenolepis orangiensis]|uniref:Reverse transcriptase domain-containing protein n=1 Tax=Muraenolepis orangiensis TaxID=630683 RepID=A0A9Q0I4A7_9TELE|nr:hypothetical protein NHX12_015205 [Muraenolepis orangiensis]
MKDLESDIVELETIRETTGDRGYIEILKEKKMALANLLDVKVQGALVRSRFLNINEMDAPTSFFFGLEKKKNGQRRVIHSLLSGTGQELTEPSQIRRRAVSFYSTLYTSEYEEGETLSEGFCNGLPQVSEEANSQLEGPLTIQELQTALQGMQGWRAPGIDGLSVEFYRAYWDVLSHDLLDVFNESGFWLYASVLQESGDHTATKKRKPAGHQELAPCVSAVCGLQTSVQGLATRLGRAVEQVIHRDQTYCVPGRSMVDNVHLIRDVLEVSSSLDINTGLISLDQEKAFNRVEHSFLWKVMEKFRFSAGFIAKIKVLYKCPKTDSLYWLLREPLIHKARLDVSSSETHCLTVALCRSKTLCLQQLVDAVGPELSDAQALGTLLGLYSVRVAQRILQLWSQILCPEEKRLLRSYGQGGARPDPADPFPEIYLSPGLGELTGRLLQGRKFRKDDNTQS